MLTHSVNVFFLGAFCGHVVQDGNRHGPTPFDMLVSCESSFKSSLGLVSIRLRSSLPVHTLTVFIVHTNDRDFQQCSPYSTIRKALEGKALGASEMCSG